MGFLKDLFKGFARSSEDVMREYQDLYAVAMKHKEGLEFVRLILINSVLGIEKEYGDISTIMLFTDRLRFNTKNGTTHRDVMIKDIVSVEMLTDIQIEEKSKVGQMMVIGLYALATKPKTEEVLKRKVVLNINEEGIDFSIILDTFDDPLTVAKELSKELEEYKNKIQEIN